MFSRNKTTNPFSSFTPKVGTKQSVWECFTKIIDGKKYYEMIRPHQIRAELYTRYHLLTSDGTITRYLRARRQSSHDIELVSRAQSLYKKVRPVGGN